MKAVRAGRAAVAALVAGLAALVLGGCGGPDLASGSGGGMETTNGISARIRLADGSPGAGAVVRIRRADFIPGGRPLTRATARDTVTGAEGGFDLRGFEPGAYTLEVTDGRGQALVARNLRLGDDVLDLGTRPLGETGSLSGVVNMANLPAGNRLWLGIYGLDRLAEARSDGGYAFDDLAPGDYELLVFSDSPAVTGGAAVFASVAGQARTSLDSVFLPMDYRSDSLAVRDYLTRQGIGDFDWASRVGVFANRIRVLRLNGLGLTRLDPALGRLGFVNSLYLGDNPLQALPDDLRRMGLFVLSLDSVPLAALPPQVAELTRIRQLSLAHTGLRDLPASLASLRELASLDLEGNGLETVPPVVFSLAGLTVLKVGHNPLRTLPDGLAALTRLEQLYAGGAELEALPDWLTAFSRLEVLHAYGNRLAALPDSLGRLAGLKVLALGRNRLATLPASLGACAALSVLRVPDNRLASLPAALASLAPRELDVAGNSLCAPPEEVAAWLDRHAPGWLARQKGCP